MREVSEMLSAWNSFYVMIGSSAAALTGLMFVVISLVRDRGESPSADGVSTFSTPTVVHFCCPLFTAALMSAPFSSLLPVAILSGIAGAGGLCYVVYIAQRQAKMRSYKADAEDWTWHVLLPLAAYGTLLAGAVAMPSAASRALYAPAAAVTILIFVGIHNAWDVVTFLAMGKANALPDHPDDAGTTKQRDPA